MWLFNQKLIGFCKEIEKLFEICYQFIGTFCKNVVRFYKDCPVFFPLSHWLHLFFFWLTKCYKANVKLRKASWLKKMLSQELNFCNLRNFLDYFNSIRSSVTNENLVKKWFYKIVILFNKYQVNVTWYLNDSLKDKTEHLNIILKVLFLCFECIVFILSLMCGSL